jgi:hypothetical protein
MTVGEYRSLTRRILEELGDTPIAGRFVSIGSQELYPLRDFVM